MGAGEAPAGSLTCGSHLPAVSAAVPAQPSAALLAACAQQCALLDRAAGAAATSDFFCSSPSAPTPPPSRPRCSSEARSLPQLALLLCTQLVNLIYQIKVYRLLTSVARCGAGCCCFSWGD